VRDSRRTRRVLVVLLVVALGLIVLSYADGSNGVLRATRNAGSAIFGGTERAASSVAKFFSSSGSSTTQVTSLQEQAAKLRAALAGERLSKSDYAQLRKLLQVAGAAQYRVVAATVIAVGTGFQQTVTIDVGTANGIRPEQTVLNGDGLVGSVTSVTADTATVLLASSSAVAVGAQVSPSGQLGIVTGPGKTVSGSGGPMHLQMLSSAAVLKPGDQLVTSASVHDRPYVPGVPIGVITKLMNANGALTESAEVRPYVDYTALGIVGVVIVPPRHNPRFAATPPLPHPGPTVTVTVTAKPGSARRGSSPTPKPSH
jgi:rod shape-determining protein MreC